MNVLWRILIFRGRVSIQFFLLAAPQYHSVSSTEVRRRLHSGESVSGFVSLEEEKLLRFFRPFPQNKTNF